VRYTVNFEHRFRVNIPLLDSPFNTTFTHQIDNSRVRYHPYSFINIGFSTVIKFVFYFEGDFAFMKGFAEKFNITDS
jgi:hypothetical protein